MTDWTAPIAVALVKKDTHKNKEEKKEKEKSFHSL